MEPAAASECLRSWGVQLDAGLIFVSKTVMFGLSCKMLEADGALLCSLLW